MELSVRFDEAKKLRIQTLTGDVTAMEFFGALDTVFNHPEFDASYKYLWDLRECRLEELPTENTLELANTIREWWSKVGTPPRGAIVASKNLGFGLSRLLSGELGGRRDLRVFRNMDEAMEWLTSSSEE